jgi:hypothetical protein
MISISPNADVYNLGADIAIFTQNKPNIIKGENKITTTLRSLEYLCQIGAGLHKLLAYRITNEPMEIAVSANEQYEATSETYGSVTKLCVKSEINAPIPKTPKVALTIFWFFVEPFLHSNPMFPP